MRIKHHQRFYLETPLRDMKCGVNDEAFQQYFRPTHITADWVDGNLVQVRIWGPRVLDDASLGERLLDYRWKTTIAKAPLDLRGVPSSVVRLIRAYQETGRHHTSSQ